MGIVSCQQIFGRIEKDIRKIPIITHRTGYIEIIEKHGKVMTLALTGYSKTKKVRAKLQKAYKNSNCKKN